MPGAVTISGQQLAKNEFEQAFAAARRYARNSRAKSNWQAYRSDWQQFETWCQSVSLQPLPTEPETIAIFLASQAAGGLSPSTLTRRLAAIRLVHLSAGHPSPHNTIQVTEVMHGIRRDWAKPSNRKAPAIVEEIKKMVDAVAPGTNKGLRDRALLLFGFAGAFRRSELVALNYRSDACFQWRGVETLTFDLMHCQTIAATLICESEQISRRSFRDNRHVLRAFRIGVLSL